MTKIKSIYANPIAIAETLANKKTLSDCCLVFRALCSYLEVSKSEDFVFGLELGFASWNHKSNQELSKNIKDSELIKNISQVSIGEEFGECIAEQVSTLNANRLEEMQVLFSDTKLI